MWELYGVWTWFLSLYTDFLEEEGEAGLGGGTREFDRKRLASLVTFGVIGSAAVSCIFVGWLGEFWSQAGKGDGLCTRKMI